MLEGNALSSAGNLKDPFLRNRYMVRVVVRYLELCTLPRTVRIGGGGRFARCIPRINKRLHSLTSIDSTWTLSQIS